MATFPRWKGEKMSEQFYWGLIAINTIFLIYEFTKNIAFGYVINNIKGELETKTTKLDDAERRYGKIILGSLPVDPISYHSVDALLSESQKFFLA